MAKPNNDAVQKTKKKGNPVVSGYLILYNTVSALAWWWCTFRVVQNAASVETTFAEIGEVVKWVQTMAALEILHSLLGFVKSPLLTTIIQVSSRLTLVWLVCDLFPVASHLYYTTMVVAWGITEVIRYGYYALNLLNLTGDHFWFLVWCRYHFFYVLYPIGAGSELLLLNRCDSVCKKDGAALSLLSVDRDQLTYPPGFYMMYTHMMKQRAKFIKSGALEAKEKAEAAAAKKKAK
ncbi:tyrosine phosphatase-like protein [Chytridium lagenaria]|nr:tyrosine phosphatase-like protein [Chytridium lagenaria]